MENVEIRDGSDVLEIVDMVTIAAACDDVTINRCIFRSTAANSGGNSAVISAAATTRLKITNCIFDGDWNVAVLDLDAAASFDTLVADNLFDQLDAGAGLTIDFHANTTGIVVRNLIHGGTDTAHPVCAAAMTAENYSSNAEGASGLIKPAVDS